jgi:hypothetical protein
MLLTFGNLVTVDPILGVYASPKTSPKLKALFKNENTPTDCLKNTPEATLNTSPKTALL